MKGIEETRITRFGIKYMLCINILINGKYYTPYFQDNVYCLEGVHRQDDIIPWV